MRTSADEVVLPETKPETEWIFGRPVQKVSPTRSHSLVQGAATAYLHAWAAGSGDVGPEWRFRITPPGERTRPLVPDVAYLSDARSAALAPDEREVPTIAPEIVVEILSPDDRRAEVLEKCRVYRLAGVLVILVVDPMARTVERFDADGSSAMVADHNRIVPALPGFVVPLDELFIDLERRRS